MKRYSSMRYSANNAWRGLFDRRELNLKGAQTKGCSSPCPLTNTNKLPRAFWPLHTTMGFLTEPKPISSCDVDQYISTTIKMVEGWSDRSKIILSVWKWGKSAQRIMGVTLHCFLCSQLRNSLFFCIIAVAINNLIYLYDLKSSARTGTRDKAFWKNCNLPKNDVLKRFGWFKVQRYDCESGTTKKSILKRTKGSHEPQPEMSPLLCL